MNRAELERYIVEIYSTQGENPWAQSPANTVFRHHHNRKWFAIIMDIPRDKLGLPGDGIISAVNVKCDPRLIGSFLPGRTGNFSCVSHEQSPLADHRAGRQRGRGEAEIPAGYEL